MDHGQCIVSKKDVYVPHLAISQHRRLLVKIFYVYRHMYIDEVYLIPEGSLRS